MIDKIIKKLLNIKSKKVNNNFLLLKEKLTFEDLKFLCFNVSKILIKETAFIEIKSPIKVVGDIHGQYEDLLRIFKSGGFPPTSRWLFLGDYVDRGCQSIETISLLFAFKIKFPQNFFILRGNHECSSINMHYGFKTECINRFNIKIWRLFCETFSCIPLSALIDKKIFCTHGGFSPDLNSFNDIKNIFTPTKVPKCGLICDLLWSDPNIDILGWRRNTRGVSYVFGKDVIEEKTRKLGIDLTIRAHQLVLKGYEFVDKCHFLTVFSAPNYLKDVKNNGAYLNVNANLKCNFNILKARD